jgi:hypothetical protein
VWSGQRESDPRLVLGKLHTRNGFLERISSMIPYVFLNSAPTKSFCVIPTFPLTGIKAVHRHSELADFRFAASSQNLIAR